MKNFTDVFGKPLKKDDVAMAVQAVVMNRTISAITLNRASRLGITKCVAILKLLEQAQVVSPAVDGERRVIARGFINHAGALNAALRQLKKSRK